MPSSADKTGWMKIVDVVKTILEIVAICVAAWWAYTRFIQEDSPSLVPRADIQGNLNWHANSSNDCEAYYEIDFQNIGKVPIEIGKVRVSAWALSDTDTAATANQVKLLEPLRMRSMPPLLEHETERIRGVYAPSEKSKNGFSFLVPRSLNKRVLFKVDLWRQEDVQRNDPNWYSYHWSWPCGEFPKALNTTPKEGESSASKPGT